MTSTLGSVKPTYLKNHGYEVLNPVLPNNDFDKGVFPWIPHLASGADTLKCCPSWLMVASPRTTCIGRSESGNADSQSAVCFSGVSSPPFA